MSDPIEALKRNMLFACQKEKAAELSTAFTGIVIAMHETYGAGEITLGLITTLGRVVAASKPDRVSDADWLDTIQRVVKQVYEKALADIRERGY